MYDDDKRVNKDGLRSERERRRNKKKKNKKRR